MLGLSTQAECMSHTHQHCAAKIASHLSPAMFEAAETLVLSNTSGGISCPVSTGQGGRVRERRQAAHLRGGRAARRCSNSTERLPVPLRRSRPSASPALRRRATFLRSPPLTRCGLTSHWTPVVLIFFFTYLFVCLLEPLSLVHVFCLNCLQ
jgi:hypothetical protein